MVVYTLKPGKYYVGDIGYAIRPSVFDGVWMRNGFKDGHYKFGPYEFAVHSTGGDGGFRASDGTSYDVDGGNIGLVDINICKKDTLTYYRVIESKEPITMNCTEEAFTIKGDSFDFTIYIYDKDEYSYDN